MGAFNFRKISKWEKYPCEQLITQGQSYLRALSSAVTLNLFEIIYDDAF